MRRTAVMTLGFVLIFIGAQLNLVETYVLTPRFTNFLMENSAPFESQPVGMPVAQNPNNPSVNSPYYQASFPGGANGTNQQPLPWSRPASSGGPKAISPPSWLCWPVLFLGTVLFLHGLSKRRD